MSMIGEQVKELRNIYEYGSTYEETKKAIEKADEAIKALMNFGYKE